LQHIGITQGRTEEIFRKSIARHRRTMVYYVHRQVTIGQQRKLRVENIDLQMKGLKDCRNLRGTLAGTMNRLFDKNVGKQEAPIQGKLARNSLQMKG
jgi:hypothetical protein